MTHSKARPRPVAHRKLGTINDLGELSDRVVLLNGLLLAERVDRGFDLRDLLVQEMDRDPSRAASVHARAAKFFDADSTVRLDRVIERANGE